MTSKERLLSALKGEMVDRTAVNFYEIGGFQVDTGDMDPFNIYNADIWKELLYLAENETDVIRMRYPDQIEKNHRYDEFFKTEVYIENGSRFTKTTLRIGSKKWFSLTRRDQGIDTVWTLKPLLEDEEDLKAYLSLPDEIFEVEYGSSVFFKEEKMTGDRGLVMVDTGDPLCEAASLFSFEDFTLMAFTQKKLFHKLLEKVSIPIYNKTKQISESFPGRLWRIYGPEYATEPYLPPSLFDEYVRGYTEPMVEMIHKHRGIVRLHSHGKIKNNLKSIVEMNVDAIDPVEPPPQGDVELEYVVKHFGRDLVLFGNVEIADIENMEPMEFERKTARSIEVGMKAKGFVLMPSASPYGREISPLTFTNYKTMIRLSRDFGGCY